MLSANGPAASYRYDPLSGRPLYTSARFRAPRTPYTDEHYALFLKCEAFRISVRELDSRWEREFFLEHGAELPDRPYFAHVGWYQLAGPDLAEYGEAFRLDPDRHTPERVTAFLAARRAARAGDPSCRLLEGVDLDPIEELPSFADEA